MGDLLLRGLDDALKLELQEHARRSGRSLSDEAIEHLRSALVRAKAQEPTAGQRLRAIVGEEKFEQSELDEIEAFRRQKDRLPPDFGQSR